MRLGVDEEVRRGLDIVGVGVKMIFILERGLKGMGVVIELKFRIEIKKRRSCPFIRGKGNYVAQQLF